MNEIRKEKLRIANLVMEIQDRGIAQMTVDFSNYGTPVTVTEWLVRGSTVTIPKRWYSQNSHPGLRYLRRELEQILKGKPVALEVAA